MVTLQDLKDLRYIQGEITALCEREREIVHRMTYAASVPAAARVKGDDGRTGEERYRDALQQVQGSLCRRRLALAEKEAAVTAYIGSVQDSLVRQILTLRFVDGLSWTAVAHRIGGGNTEESVKKAFYRFWAHEIRTRQ